MTILPSGTVTFLFTDIEGSTKLAQEYPDAMPALLSRHHAVLQNAIASHNGHVFQIVGDAFHAAFYTVGDALAAALDAQRELLHELWDPAPVKVRMGIHTGAAQAGVLDERAGGYVGYLTLARAQRVMSVASGGQVLVSNATAELARADLPKGVVLRDLREHRLKGLLNPEHIWQVDAPGLPQEFSPLPSLNAIPNNLPVQLTSFIGREKEIEQVKGELTSHHLVTLTGSGGTGKTRLSLQVAADLLDEFQDGVWFIELAPLTDPQLVPQTILSTMNLAEQRGKMPLEVLKEYLRDKKVLLVLDNCEHLIEATARVAQTLLATSPHSKILASSREALGVQGELSYPVPSLSLPDPKNLPVVEQASRYEAVHLFIDRAALVSPHFELNQENAPVIAQICYRLDGIPLAIELAAARVKLLSVEQISKRLDDRFRLLTGGARTALPRQQTLRALIDWSYDLLPANERLLLLRLSVFAGGWTLEAMEHVCAGDEIESADALDLLTQLVNKSLVLVIEHSPSGETRYRLLETIRQYAREKQVEAGDLEILRQRHLAYFVKLVEQAEPELYRSNQVHWSNRLEEEIDNLRIALEWALGEQVESGLRITVLPWRFWLLRGFGTELGEWLGKLLERDHHTGPLHAKALAVYAFCIFRQGDFHETLRLANRSLQMARALSDQQTEAFSLSFLGVVTLLQGNVSEGIPLLEQSLALYRDLGDKVGQANTTIWLSINNPDIEHAISYAKTGLSLHRDLGNLSGIASTLILLARLTMWKGDFSSPAPWLQEARLILLEIGDQTTQEERLNTSGNLAYWQQDYGRARECYLETLKLSERLGDQYQNLWARVFMAYAILRQGDISSAHESFLDCIRRAQKADSKIVLVYAIEGVASLHVQEGSVERAAALFAWADKMRDTIGDHRPPVEQNSVRRDLEVIRTRLDNSTYDEACQTGRALTMEKATAYAMGMQEQTLQV